MKSLDDQLINATRNLKADHVAHSMNLMVPGVNFVGCNKGQLRDSILRSWSEQFDRIGFETVCYIFCNLPRGAKTADIVRETRRMLNETAKDRAAEGR